MGAARLVAVLGFAFTLASCLGTVWRGLVAHARARRRLRRASRSPASRWQLWLPVVVPLLGLLPLAIGLGQAVHYLGAARWLGVYAPHQVSQRLLKGGDFAAARRRLREVTVMLTDIVGFTTLAEQSTPAAVTGLRQPAFHHAHACVEAEGGDVGAVHRRQRDVVLGRTGPAARPRRARLPGCAGDRGGAQGRERPAADGVEPVRMRIGINTGEVTAGNVGAPGRSSYGIVGDMVNATQRIEQLAKTLCHDQPTAAILVSGRTRAQAGDGFTFVEAGAHEVRGRREPVMSAPRWRAPPVEEGSTQRVVG